MGGATARVAAFAVAVALYVHNLDGEFLLDDHHTVLKHPGIRDDYPAGRFFALDYWVRAAGAGIRSQATSPSRCAAASFVRAGRLHIRRATR